MSKIHHPMPSIFQRTFGGLETQYYYRHLFFGSLLLVLLMALIIYLGVSGNAPIPSLFAMGIWGITTTLLCPYSRFLIDIVIDFFMGDVTVHQTFTNYVSNSYTKVAISWGAAVILSPIALLVLLIVNTKSIKNKQREASLQENE